MSERQEIINEIQELKKYLNELIEKKASLQDAEVITASKLLDTILNEYEKVINTKQ